MYGRKLIRTEKVDEWLDIVGLKGFGNTPTYQLSGGMQQRVALARCLINDPDLIIDVLLNSLSSIGNKYFNDNNESFTLPT